MPNAAVSAYHHGLAMHLQAMLAGAGASAAVAHPMPASRTHKPKTLSVTGRKRSDDSGSGTIASVSESALGTSQRGSLTTADSGVSMGETVPSGPSRRSSADSEPRSQREVLQETTEEDAAGEEEQETRSDDPHDFTARLEPQPHPSIPPVHVHMSSNSARRGSNSSQRSSRSSSGSRQPSHAVLQPSSSREEEHHSAWAAEGRRMWRQGPKSFALRLEDLESRSRRGSQASAARGVYTRSRQAGSSIGAQANYGSSELDEGMQDLQMERKDSRVTDMSSNHPYDGYNAGLALPARSQTASHASSSGLHPPAHHADPTTRALLKEDYEVRRQAKLARRKGELDKRVQIWAIQVQAWCGSGPVEFPEIEPTPASPGASATSHTTFTLKPSPAPRAHVRSRAEPPTLPLTKPATYVFGGKQQPLFIIPPTPDLEKPAPKFDLPVSTASRSGTMPRFVKKGMGIGGGDRRDMTERLHTLEALMGSLAGPMSGPQGSVILGDTGSRGGGGGTSPDQTPRASNGPQLA